MEKIFKKIKILIIFILNFYIIIADENIGEKNMNNIKVIIKNEIYKIKMQDNLSARNFIDKLPLEIDMYELNRNEKYGDIPSDIPKSERYSGKIEIGDLMLYGSDCIVLFYKSFSTPYTYSRLGTVIEKEKLIKNINEKDKKLRVIFLKGKN